MSADLKTLRKIQSVIPGLFRLNGFIEDEWLGARQNRNIIGNRIRNAETLTSTPSQDQVICKIVFTMHPWCEDPLVFIVIIFANAKNKFEFFQVGIGVFSKCTRNFLFMGL